jgi:hypothetical protein
VTGRAAAASYPPARPASDHGRPDTSGAHGRACHPPAHVRVAHPRLTPVQDHAGLDTLPAVAHPRAHAMTPRGRMSPRRRPGQSPAVTGDRPC